MQQHPRQNAAGTLGQPAQKNAAGKGRQPLRQIQMQQTEQQCRSKDSRRTAAGAHQPLKRAAEQHLLGHSGHHAEGQKVDRKLGPAAGQHLAGGLPPADVVDERPRQIGKIGHPQKNRQAEAWAPRRRQRDAQIIRLQPRTFQQKDEREGDSPEANQQL